MFPVVLVSACYSPHPQPGAPCPDGVCPEGLLCAPLTHVCELTGGDTDVPGRDASLIDASADAPPASAAATLVQQVHASSSSAATLSVTLAPPAMGHVLVMI